MNVLNHLSNLNILQLKKNQKNKTVHLPSLQPPFTFYGDFPLPEALSSLIISLDQETRKNPNLRTKSGSLTPLASNNFKRYRFLNVGQHTLQHCASPAGKVPIIARQDPRKFWRVKPEPMNWKEARPPFQ